LLSCRAYHCFASCAVCFNVVYTVSELKLDCIPCCGRLWCSITTTFDCVVDRNWTCTYIFATAQRHRRI